MIQIANGWLWSGGMDARNVAHAPCVLGLAERQPHTAPLAVVSRRLQVVRGAWLTEFFWVVVGVGVGVGRVGD